MICMDAIWRAEYPKFIYAIFPYDEKQKCIGAYIGITRNPKERIISHLSNTKNDPQKEMHRLMRENGYQFQILETIVRYADTYNEYHWIDYFEKQTDLKVFNRSKGNHADYRKLKKTAICYL